MTSTGWIEAMAKHLPPSGSALRLLDVEGAAGSVLSCLRPDVDVQTVATDGEGWPLGENTVDAIAIYDQVITTEMLAAALRVLRSGGRLIAVDPAGIPAQAWVDRLEGAGFTRILVEGALDNAPTGVLIRGEKPHITEDTLQRIRVAAQQDDLLTDLGHYPGRFLYLLIRQTPNKPVWALREEERLAWQAVTLGGEQPTVNSSQQSASISPNSKLSQPTLLAFSSLAKAVAFMQPAILAGRIRDINKVGKFSIETARTWGLPILLNPADSVLVDHMQGLIPIDPATAEHADE